MNIETHTVNARAITMAKKQGGQLEHDLMLKWLEQLGVIRPSMIGHGYWVIYTENGAVDIHSDELREIRMK